jgi:hypothetical protein
MEDLERFKEGRGFLNLICSFFMFLKLDIPSMIHWIVPLRRHFSFGIFYFLLAMRV